MRGTKRRYKDDPSTHERTIALSFSLSFKHTHAHIHTTHTHIHTHEEWETHAAVPSLQSGRLQVEVQQRAQRTSHCVALALRRERLGRLGRKRGRLLRPRRRGVADVAGVTPPRLEDHLGRFRDDVLGHLADGLPERSQRQTVV